MDAKVLATLILQERAAVGLIEPTGEAAKKLALSDAKALVEFLKKHVSVVGTSPSGAVTGELQ